MRSALDLPWMRAQCDAFPDFSNHYFGGSQTVGPLLTSASSLSPDPRAGWAVRFGYRTSKVALTGGQFSLTLGELFEGGLRTDRLAWLQHNFRLYPLPKDEYDCGNL